MVAGDALIQLDSVTFAYSGNHTVLREASLTLQPGRRIGIVGPNGCGKTTLLHLIVGLLKPASGSVTAFGRPREEEADFHEVRRRVGLLFQNSDDQLFCPTVLEDVAFGPLNLGKSRDEAKRIASDTLDRLGLSGFEGRITYKLSGGEKRLVALATVLAMDPEVLLLDEPAAGLDEEATVRLLEVLRALPQAMIFASHEPNFLAALATDILRLNHGQLAPAGHTPRPQGLG
jgi:cobalt/nickel transport system ATP-binding protein